MNRTYLAYAGGAIAVCLAVVIWVFQGSATRDFDEPIIVDIAPGSNFSAVTDSLVARRILAAPGRFRFVAKLTGWDKKIKAGRYVIPSGMSVYRLLEVLRKGLQSPLRVTVPPGTRKEVFASVMHRDLGVDSAAVRAAFSDEDLARQLGTDTVHLFGYMIPETLEFFWGATPENIVSRLKRTFDEYFTEDMEARAKQLDLTKDEVITLASIVEWEARVDSERSIIAGVYLNRLERRMPLQADPTVQFAIMQELGGRMRRLVFSDYKMEHPYNTYLYYGLPPGPITNPSLASIKAVLAPERHEYLFFVADGEGGHIFSRTLREHNNAANTYRELMKERRRQVADSD